MSGAAVASPPRRLRSPQGRSLPSLRIGLVYDLRSEYLALGYSEEDTAEFDQEGTIVALESTLLELGHRPERIGRVERLLERLAEGRRWDLVFNIAEGLYGFGREALVPALLDHYGIPYTFADPLAAAVTLHKGAAKRVVRDAGIPTPDFAVVETRADLPVDLPFPLFVKPVAEGTGKGTGPSSIVRNHRAMRQLCLELLERYHQPVLVETLLTGRELTVGILGTGHQARSLGTLEVKLLAGAEAGVYSYVNKERCEQLVEYGFVGAAEDPVVREAEAIAVAAWRALGCRDGGRVDVRCDDAGRPFFLEANPLAGLHPHHSDLPILCHRAGIPYRELISGIVRSAYARGTIGRCERARQPALQLG